MKRSRCPTWNTAALRLGERDELPCFFWRFGNWLFDEHVHAGIEKIRAIAKCAGVVVTTLTASTLPISSR